MGIRTTPEGRNEWIDESVKQALKQGSKQLASHQPNRSIGQSVD